MAERQYVVFELGNEKFGINIARVWEIVTSRPITKVPNTPPFVEGIINLRSKVVPVFDLGKRFQLPTTKEYNSKRIVVVEIGGNTLGMIVDGVSEVLRINSDIVETPPSVITNVDSDYLEGVAKLADQLIILLDLDEMLTKQEKQAIEAIN